MIDYLIEERGKIDNQVFLTEDGVIGKLFITGYGDWFECIGKNDVGQEIKLRATPTHINETKQNVYYNIALDLYDKHKNKENSNPRYNRQTGQDFKSSYKVISAMFDVIIQEIKKTYTRRNSYNVMVCIFGTNKRRLDIYSWFIKRKGFNATKQMFLGELCLMFPLYNITEKEEARQYE
jgi:hypothetical protein